MLERIVMMHLPLLLMLLHNFLSLLLLLSLFAERVRIDLIFDRIVRI
jgi:hypothetical protein